MPVEHLRLRDLESQYAARSLTEAESAVAIQEIEAGTFHNEGIVGIPLLDSPDFRQVRIETLPEDRLKKQVVDIFTAGKRENPHDVYVLSEEESIGRRGLTKFTFENFLVYVIPYIREWGQLTDYWVTDALQTTITFHREGIMYWRTNRETPPTAKKN